MANKYYMFQSNEFEDYDKSRVSLQELKLFYDSRENLQTYGDPKNLYVGLRSDEEKIIRYVGLVDLKVPATNTKMRDFVKELTNYGEDT